MKTKIIHITEPQTLINRLKDWYLNKFCQDKLQEDFEREQAITNE